MEDALKKARELLEIVAPYGLAEFEYTDGSLTVRFSRESARPQAVQAAAPAPLPPVAAPVVEPARPREDGKYVAIRSPMVGTFYSAPAPDKPPYANEGEIVEKGQVVCIIEAMKLMNEIKSPTRGRLAKTLVQNATAVAKDEILFQVEPV